METEQRDKRGKDKHKQVHYYSEEEDQYVMRFNGPEKCLIEIMVALASLCKHNEAK